MADPTPDAEDYRRADLLMAGGDWTDPGIRELFAGGIAVARAGGDVQDYLRRHAHSHTLLGYRHTLRTRESDR